MSFVREDLEHHGSDFTADTPLTLAVDPQGHPHIGWWGPTGAYHRWFDGKTWNTEKLADHPVTQMVFVMDGDQVCALHDRGAEPTRFVYTEQGQLLFRRRTGGEWSASLVAEAGWTHGVYGAGFYWDVAIDAQGRVGVAWRTQNAVHLAVQEREHWSSAVLLEAGEFLGQVRLCADGDTFHLLYSHDHHAHHAEGTHPDAMVSTPLTGRYEDNFLAIAALNGVIHTVSMGDAGTKCRAFYRRRAKGAWSEPVMLKKSRNNGYGNQLVLDEEGQPSIFFRGHKSHRNQGFAHEPCSLHLARPGTKGFEVEDLGESGFVSDIAQGGGKLWMAFSPNLRGGLAVAHGGPATLDVPLAPPDTRYPVEIYRDTAAEMFAAAGVLELLHDNGKKFAKLYMEDDSLMLEKGKVGKAGKAKSIPLKKFTAPEMAGRLAAFDLDEYTLEGLDRPW